MTIQLYSSTKPALPHRTWISATSLLLATLILAFIMTWQRAGGIPAPRFEPPGWAISFQPPSGFHSALPMLTPVGPAYQFRSLPDGGAAIILTLTRAGLDPTDQPITVCKRVFRTFLRSGDSWYGDLALTDDTKKLGPLNAVELWDPNPNINNIIVRAVVLEDGDAYAVSLAVQGGITPTIYEVFDQACSTVAMQSK